MKSLFCWGLAAVLPWGTMAVRAQTVSSGQAKIIAITEGREVQRFRVPQVQLANAAVAGRINRRILRLMLGEAADSALSVARQLQQAERACCYDAENGQGWSTTGKGLTDCNYNILLNQQGLLSVEYISGFTGAYYWERANYATFDLRTGRQLALADLVADAPAQLTRRMHGAISRRFGEALAEIADGNDSTEIADMAERFCWYWKAKRVRFESDPGPADAARAAEPDLESFALTPTEVRLYYQQVMPHVMLNLEPDNTYHYPFDRIQPRGLLLPLAKAALVKQSK